MGKSPMAYHGHERSRHHNYSRNSQSRNRRSENQGFAPANYIYTPDRFLRQLPTYRSGSQYGGPGSSQQYLKVRSYHNRPYSTARVRSPLVQKRLPPQRKRTRRDMHPPGESEAASKSSEQSADVIKNENELSSEGQEMGEDPSSNAVQASAPQTRSSAKAQQNKSEENIDASKGEGEDGSVMSQPSSPQTRSSTKVQSKAEEVAVPDKSENEDSDNKVNRTTRGSSKVRNDDKSGSTVEVHPTEERVTGHNTRSATKARLDISDESEQQEEGGNISKTRKVRKDTKITISDVEGDTESTHRQESEGLAPVEIKKTSTQINLMESCQISEEVSVEVTLATETTKSEKLVTRNDKEASTVLPSVKQLVGNKSPRLILSQVDTHTEKHRDPSPEKGTNTTAASRDITEIKDSPRRSSRRGSSRMKIEKEDTQVLHRTPHRDHSRTPVRIQQSVEPRERADSFAASIRSISCRRSIRDSPSVSNVNETLQKQSFLKQHVQMTVTKTHNEYLSGNNLDVPADKSIDVTTESDESSVSADKMGKWKVTTESDEADKMGKRKVTTESDESSVSADKTGKRKASTLETVVKDQEHKKKRTLKSELNFSSVSAVSSPLQLPIQKQEPVSSSTPLKVVECCETVHMELSEESITDESVAYEKAQDNITEQSLSFEKGAPVPEPICEPASRKWCSVM